MRAEGKGSHCEEKPALGARAKHLGCAGLPCWPVLACFALSTALANWPTSPFSNTRRRARVALIGRRTLRTRNRIVQKVDGPKNRTWLDSAWGPFLSTHQAMTLLVSEEPICTRLRKQSSEPRRSMRLHSPAVLRVESREDSHSHQPHSLSPILNAHLKGCLRRGPFITRIECPYQRVFQNWRLATASQKISTVTGLPAWYTLVPPYMHSMTAKPIDKNSAA